MRTLNALAAALLLSFGLAGCSAGESSTAEEPGSEAALSTPPIQCTPLYSNGTCGGVGAGGGGTTVGSTCIAQFTHEHGICTGSAKPGGITTCDCNTADTCQETTGPCAGHQVGATCSASNGKHAVCDNDNPNSACRCVNTIN